MSSCERMAMSLKPSKPRIVCNSNIFDLLLVLAKRLQYIVAYTTLSRGVCTRLALVVSMLCVMSLTMNGGNRFINLVATYVVFHLGQYLLIFFCISLRGLLFIMERALLIPAPVTRRPFRHSPLAAISDRLPLFILIQRCSVQEAMLAILQLRMESQLLDAVRD